MEKKLTEYCVPRFQRLKSYLEDLIVQDWADCSPEQVAVLFPPELRPLAAAFHSFLERNGVFNPPPDPSSLNLSGVVTSKLLKGFRKTTLEQALEELQHNNLGPFSHIDLRDSNLMDVDAGDVLQLCRIVVGKGATHVVVNISGNRFSAAALPTFAGICDLPGIKNLYVPEVGNPEAIAELQKWTDRQLGKLIFIREIHLAMAGWKNLVPDPQRQALVERAHRDFYATYTHV